MSTQMILAIITVFLFITLGLSITSLVALKVLADVVHHLETRVDELTSDRK